MSSTLKLVNRWFVDNEIVPGNHGTEYRIKGISRTFHNKIVKCEVNNVIGKSEETETLDINCKPFPASLYTLFKNASFYLFSSFSRYNLNNTNWKSMSCVFLLDDYGQTLIANHRQAEALLKSCFFPESDAPKFLVEPSDVSGESGQNAVLTCKVDGNPAPAYTWFRNGDLQTVSECFLKKFATPGIIYNYQPLFLHSRQILHNVNCRL